MLSNEKKDLIEKIKSWQSLYADDPHSYYSLEQELGHSLLDQYGIDGLEVWLEAKYFEDTKSCEIFSFRDLPPNCPWSALPAESLAGFIDSIFTANKYVTKSSVSVLKKYCKNIFCLKIDEDYYLLYYFDLSIHENPTRFKLWIGGAPLSSSLSNQSDLPKALSSFYRIHNGFGLFSNLYSVWISNCILPFQSLEAAPAPNNDYLLFCPSAFGGGFYLNQAAENELAVSFSKHPEEEMSPLAKFDDFLFEFFSSEFELQD